MNPYLAGSLVRVSAAFALPDGTVTGRPADPGTITLSYRTPGASDPIVITSPDVRIVRDGTGQYHADLDTTGLPGGKFTYAWSGTGGVQAAGEGVFLVQVQFA